MNKKEPICPKCGEHLAISCGGEGEMVQFACGSYYYKRDPKNFYDSKKCLKSQVKKLEEYVKELQEELEKVSDDLGYCTRR